VRAITARSESSSTRTHGPSTAVTPVRHVKDSTGRPGGRRGHPGERRRDAKGQVTGVGAILERTVVDKAGERP